MQNETKIPSLVTGFMIGIISYWFNAYNDNQVAGINIFYLMGALSFIASIGLVLYFRKRPYRIVLFLSLGFLVAALARIVFDTMKDHSSHNLLPLEIAMILGIVAASSFLGAFLISLVVKKR